jgi:hypothetical protein
VLQVFDVLGQFAVGSGGDQSQQRVENPCHGCIVVSGGVAGGLHIAKLYPLLMQMRLSLSESPLTRPCDLRGLEPIRMPSEMRRGSTEPKGFLMCCLSMALPPIAPAS